MTVENTRPKIGAGGNNRSSWTCAGFAGPDCRSMNQEPIGTSSPARVKMTCRERLNPRLVALICLREYISTDNSSGQLISTWLDWGMPWMQGKHLKSSSGGSHPLPFVGILCHAGLIEDGLMFQVGSKSVSYEACPPRFVWLRFFFQSTEGNRQPQWMICLSWK